jgi:hypothetical protein
MPHDPAARWLLANAAGGLLTRLERVQAFGLHIPAVPAAGVSAAAQFAVENYLADGRRELHGLVRDYLGWLDTPAGRAASSAEAQRRWVLLRLRFQRVLTQFDIFADALNQRSEHEYGVRLAGLDVLAADALQLPGQVYEPPPVIVYLDRGSGAAIRRARTRLPGGGENPVAIIRVPRERMVGSGIGSSLVHEVGHQAAALLDLVASSKLALRAAQASDPVNALEWEIWLRWISEIVADLWAVAKLGVGALLGLMAVVSLPRPFMFRLRLDDPHPLPWLRVKLVAAMGDALYPHPHWRQLTVLWQELYPLDGLTERDRAALVRLEAHLPWFVTLLLEHKPPKLGGRRLKEALSVQECHPAELRARFDGWRTNPRAIAMTRPAMAFAVLGQAVASGRIRPEAEARLVDRLLRDWALRRAITYPQHQFPRLRQCRCEPRQAAAQESFPSRWREDNVERQWQYAAV